MAPSIATILTINSVQRGCLALGASVAGGAERAWSDDNVCAQKNWNARPRAIWQLQLSSTTKTRIWNWHPQRNARTTMTVATTCQCCHLIIMMKEEKADESMLSFSSSSSLAPLLLLLMLKNERRSTIDDRRWGGDRSFNAGTTVRTIARCAMPIMVRCTAFINRSYLVQAGTGTTSRLESTSRKTWKMWTHTHRCYIGWNNLHVAEIFEICALCMLQ